MPGGFLYFKPFFTKKQSQFIQQTAASCFFWARRLQTRYFAETILGLPYLSATTAL
jgi:hypothetical protein